MYVMIACHLQGINQTPVAALFWDAIYPLLQPGTSLALSVFGFTVLCFLLCLVFTSIPCVLLVAPHLIELSGPLTTFAWLLLAWCVTLCGNVTIFSSVAGVIVAEYAQAAMEPISFMEWVRYAVPSTIVIVASGAIVITFQNQYMGPLRS
jgi:Na+/H+ antiporter NhaD/arsenite permease-like protein